MKPANYLDHHDGPSFRCPSDLQVKAAPVRRALLVGVCGASHLKGSLEALQQTPCDFVHIGALANSDASIPLGIPEYDFLVVIPPLDHMLPGHRHMPANVRDREEVRRLFDDSLTELDRLLAAPLEIARKYSLPTFIANFFVPQINPLGRLLPRYDLSNVCYYVESLNRHIGEQIDALDNVFLLDIDSISATFGKKYIQDDSVWHSNHGGFFTDVDFDLEMERGESNRRLEALSRVGEYYSSHVPTYNRALAEEVLFLYRSIRRQAEVKLVVIDLDDTAWRGVAVEEDPSQEFLITGWPLGFIEALLFLKRRGILLAIISKNDETKARKIWNHAYGNYFPLDSFASIKINWRPKVDNLEEILTETNLLPRNTLYIDDNPVERASISTTFEGVRTLGANPFYLRRLLLWSSETERVFISDESVKRTEMVQQQIKREGLRRSLTHKEFIASLDLRISFVEIEDEAHPKFKRAFELLNKTNQFNTTGRRWTEAEFGLAFASGASILAADVEDKFTPYGIVFVAVLLEAEIVQVAMSCRVIGLGVEAAALEAIETLMRGNGAESISALDVKTEHNILSRSLFKDHGFELREDGVWAKSLAESRDQKAVAEAAQ